ncbi:hypothetical protein BT96DRAFT_985321 [Gymnopus androsaceus JB14]|uniref:feruloyl esterase n=1 Tax=Gymnopus androsaceus JB14 TaxID=1447944 RepID=A0A6A4IJ21_9AGAR|nr:hypothetical protein BT96DRAFT_985321 [Gymnopus androsaceus JB14]
MGSFQWTFIPISLENTFSDGSARGHALLNALLAVVLSHYPLKLCIPNSSVPAFYWAWLLLSEHLHHACELLLALQMKLRCPPSSAQEVTSMVASVMNDYGSTPSNDVCLVNITITHPGANDTVNNWVVLPLTGWNGVFQGLGGGGYSAGDLSTLAVESALGYSAVVTDAGHNTSFDLTRDCFSVGARFYWERESVPFIQLCPTFAA